MAKMRTMIDGRTASGALSKNPCPGARTAAQRAVSPQKTVTGRALAGLLQTGNRRMTTGFGGSAKADQIGSKK